MITNTLILAALTSLSEEERVNVTTCELACVLFENSPDEFETLLTRIIELIRHHHAELIECDEQARFQAERVANFKRVRGTGLKVVK